MALSLFFYVHEGLRGRCNPVFGEHPGLLEYVQSPQLVGVCNSAAREVVHELCARYPRAGMRLLPEPLGRILQHARHLDQSHHLLHGSRGINQDAVHLALGDRPAELEPLRALQDSADIFRLDGKKNCRHGQVFTNLTFIPRMWAFPGVRPLACHPRPFGVLRVCSGGDLQGATSLSRAIWTATPSAASLGHKIMQA